MPFVFQPIVNDKRPLRRQVRKILYWSGGGSSSGGAMTGEP